MGGPGPPWPLSTLRLCFRLNGAWFAAHYNRFEHFSMKLFSFRIVPDSFLYIVGSIFICVSLPYCKSYALRWLKYYLVQGCPNLYLSVKYGIIFNTNLYLLVFRQYTWKKFKDWYYNFGFYSRKISSQSLSSSKSSVESSLVWLYIKLSNRFLII